MRGSNGPLCCQSIGDGHEEESSGDRRGGDSRLLAGGWALAQSGGVGPGGFGPPFMQGQGPGGMGPGMMQHMGQGMGPGMGNGMMGHMGGGMGPGMMHGAAGPTRSIRRGSIR